MDAKGECVTLWSMGMKICVKPWDRNVVWELPRGFPGGASDKESTCQCRRHKKCKFDLWAGKIPWSRKWQLAPVLLLGKSRGQRSLAGYSSQGRKESDVAETERQQLLIELQTLDWSGGVSSACFLACSFSLGELTQPHHVKYDLYTDDCHLYIFIPDPSPQLQSLKQLPQTFPLEISD